LHVSGVFLRRLHAFTGRLEPLAPACAVVQVVPGNLVVELRRGWAGVQEYFAS
jgi:hypothetical protein